MQVLPGAGFDREPRIRAVRAKADAFVSEAAPRANFGHARTLRVDASPTVRTYIRFNFDLSSVQVRHVSLLLYSRTRSRAGYQVRIAEGRWKERQINFVNAPRPLPRFVGSGPLRAQSWKAVDVTSLVAGLLSSVNLVLMTTSANDTRFASRETGLHGPRLVVETIPTETTTSTRTVAPPPPPGG